MRLKHLAYRTEKTYLAWALCFESHCGPKCCSEITQDDLKGFPSYLAVERRVSAATQRQAFNALLFLFRNVLSVGVNGLDSVIRSRMPRSSRSFSRPRR